MTLDVARLDLVTIKLDTEQPCRWCGHPTTMADEDGPTHRCCNAWQIVGRRCPGCAESASAWTTFYDRRPDLAPKTHKSPKRRKRKP